MGQFIHFGTQIWSELQRFDPQVTVTSGYGQVMLLALCWCLMKKRPHIAFTDGTIDSEARLSIAHRIVRRFVIKHSSAFIGASAKSLELFKSYGAANNQLFQSCLCVDNANFAPLSSDSKKFDLMFSGRLVEGKMPLFFTDVVGEVARRHSRCSALVLGSGGLDASVRSALIAAGVDFEMPGFVQPADLPTYYRQARIFLFPTQQEAWGVVANEAAAAGLPIITTPEAGVAGELVRHGINGFVLPASVNVWAEAALTLLDNQRVYEQMSSASLDISNNFSYERAVKGLHDAINFAVRNPSENTGFKRG